MCVEHFRFINIISENMQKQRAWNGSRFDRERERERDSERVPFIKAVSMHTLAQTHTQRERRRQTHCVSLVLCMYCIIDLDDMLDGNK